MPKSLFGGNCAAYGPIYFSSMVWNTLSRQTKKTMAQRHIRLDGYKYIQLKEMSVDREQWRKKTREWSAAVANPWRRKADLGESGREIIVTRTIRCSQCVVNKTYRSSEKHATKSWSRQ